MSDTPDVHNNWKVEAVEDEPAVTATPSRVCTGYSFGAGDVPTRCVDCQTRLRDGAYVEAYAYQLEDETQWDLPRLYCRGCAPIELTPTQGVTELLIRGRLGTTTYKHHHTTTLGYVELLAYSPPGSGTPP